MGYQNVALAFAHWSGPIGSRHILMRALLAMSLLALDEPSEGQPAREYFGGAEWLARQLGRVEPFGAADFRSVEAAVSQLADLGAVTRLNRPTRGRRAVYRLHLDGPKGRSGLSVTGPDDGLAPGLAGGYGTELAPGSPTGDAELAPGSPTGYFPALSLVSPRFCGELAPGSPTGLRERTEGRIMDKIISPESPSHLRPSLETIMGADALPMPTNFRAAVRGLAQEATP